MSKANVNIPHGICVSERSNVRRFLSRRTLTGRLWLTVFYLVLVIFTVMPIASLVVRGFVDTENSRVVLTLNAVSAVLGEPSYWAAMWNTVVISIGAMLLATAIGVILAWCLVRTNVPWARLLEQLATLPIFIPPFIGAFAWVLIGAPRVGLLNLTFRGLGGGELVDIYTYLGIIWTTAIYIAPYVMMIVAAALRNMDPSLEEAAQISGLNRVRTMLLITLPVVAPSILSGAVLSFVICIGLFGTPVLLGMTKEIYMVTTRIYTELQHFPPNFGIVAVLAIYLMVLSVIANLLQGWALKGRSFVTVTGKGFRPRIITLASGRYLVAAVIWLYLVLTVIGPVIIIAAAAFSTFTWSGTFTWANVTFLWTSEDVRSTLWNSVVITIIAATATTVLGFAVSWITVRTRIAGREILQFIVLLPMSIPSLAFALGVSFFWLWTPWSVYGTIWIIIIGLIGRYVSYAVRAVTSSLMQIHPELEESARVSGFGWLSTVRRITLPLVLPAIISSWVMVYSIYISELSMVLPLYTANTRTLSILSFDTWAVGEFSQVASLSLLQLVLGAGVMWLVTAFTRQRHATAV
ncbi:ABC transporter permease [Phyllobacterium zundukense]|uniref:Iron ABC transporter permease n=1 Tax=Phyllobacterium zundukense TaxID=1867719 RepID=A0ACD4CV35_9HYPH|nr:iron ABC transporter permease [Phyllobacterium zundukense]UXN57421.1 iron ABC transporter permease [Phyllobacterium zundukense]